MTSESGPKSLLRQEQASCLAASDFSASGMEISEIFAGRMNKERFFPDNMKSALMKSRVPPFTTETSAFSSTKRYISEKRSTLPLHSGYELIPKGALYPYVLLNCLHKRIGLEGSASYFFEIEILL